MLKTRLWIEFTLLFVGGPLLMRSGFLPGHKIIWLALASAGCLAWLMGSEGFGTSELFGWRNEGSGPNRSGAEPGKPDLRSRVRVGKVLLGSSRNENSLRGMVLRSALVGVAVLLLVLVSEPEQLFAFPRSRPLLWLVVVALYPVLSAYPQELIYRAFFFRRYAALFPSAASMVLASAGAFAWLHVIYGNAPVLLLSLVGGLVFAQVYRSSRSLFWTSIEHAAYGLLVFSIGLGHYFYNGPR